MQKRFIFPTLFNYFRAVGSNALGTLPFFAVQNSFCPKIFLLQQHSSIDLDLEVALLLDALPLPLGVGGRGGGGAPVGSRSVREHGQVELRTLE